MQRAVGTAIGMLPALGLLLLELPLWAVPLVVAAMQVLVELFVARNYALALVFITPLALVVGDLAYPQPTATVLGDRLVEDHRSRGGQSRGAPRAGRTQGPARPLMTFDR